HYVSIQRLRNNTALVIWNTFDENGTPVWLYGVGDVLSGSYIHVGEVAQNVGGKLQPGGNVTGSKAQLWGYLNVAFTDWYNARLAYTAQVPFFGAGATSLQRLAFLDGVDCAP